MASKPKSAKKAVKKQAGTKKPAAKKAAVAETRKPKHGGTVITQEMIEQAASLNAPPPPTIRLPSERYVQNFFKVELPKLEKEKDSSVKDMRDLYKVGQSNNHMDKKATAIVKGLFNMPDSKLYVTMWHLAHMIKALSLWERALRQGQLDFEKAQEAQQELKNQAGEGEAPGEGEAAEDQTDDKPGKTAARKHRMRIEDAVPHASLETIADNMHKSINGGGEPKPDEPTEAQPEAAEGETTGEAA